jgi:hypothetical protein
MRPRALICLFLGLALVGIATPVHAGGNWLEVRDDYLVAGEKLVVKNRYFTDADVAEGPYFVYLFAGDDAWSPPLPAFGRALVLGRVRIMWPPEGGWKNRSMPQNPVLRGEFDMPRVAPGRYLLHICNRPCTQKIDWVGPAMIRVVPTPAVERLHERIDSLQGRLVTFRYNDRRMERRRYSQLVNAVERDIEDLRTSLDAVRSVPEQAPGTPSTPIWIPLALALVAASSLFSLALSLRSRRGREIDWDRLLDRAEQRDRIGTPS